MNQILGSWSHDDFYETWYKLNDTCFLGFVIDLKSFDTTERIEVYPMKGEYIFAPTVYGQNDDDPIFFDFERQEKNSIIFNNPSHDWPKKIEYIKSTPDSLIAIVSGTDSTEYKEFVVKYLRSSDFLTSEGIALTQHMKNRFKYLFRNKSAAELIDWIELNKYLIPNTYAYSKGDVFATCYNLRQNAILSDSSNKPVVLSNTADSVDISKLMAILILETDSLNYYGLEKTPEGKKLLKLYGNNSYTLYELGKSTKTVSGKYSPNSDTLNIHQMGFIKKDSVLKCISCKSDFLLFRP